MATLEAAWIALEAAIESVPELPGAESGELDPRRLPELLRDLEVALARDDTAASEIFDVHRAVLDQSFGPQAIQIERELASFDYPRALATVRDLIRRLG